MVSILPHDVESYTIEHIPLLAKKSHLAEASASGCVSMVVYVMASVSKPTDSPFATVPLPLLM